MQVCLHQVRHNVDVAVARPGLGPQDAFEADDVLVVEELYPSDTGHQAIRDEEEGEGINTQQLDFAQDSFGVYQVVEGVRDLLDRVLLPAGLVRKGADHPVGALAEQLDEGVLVRD